MLGYDARARPSPSLPPLCYACLSFKPFFLALHASLLLPPAERPNIDEARANQTVKAAMSLRFDRARSPREGYRGKLISFSHRLISTGPRSSPSPRRAAVRQQSSWPTPPPSSPPSCPTACLTSQTMLITNRPWSTGVVLPVAILKFKGEIGVLDKTDSVHLKTPLSTI